MGDDARVGSVAVLGTGIMGSAMARNLAASGLATSAWNRNPARARPLAEHGIEVFASPAEAVAGRDAVVTMLADANAVGEVMSAEVIAAVGGSAVWIQASTVGLAGTEELMVTAGEAGLAFVDAPVSGTKEPAEAGRLLVLASGDEDALRRCEPILDAIGSRTLRLGPAGAGTRMKLVVNAWLP